MGVVDTIRCYREWAGGVPLRAMPIIAKYAMNGAPGLSGVASPLVCQRWSMSRMSSRKRSAEICRELGLSLSMVSYWVWW